MRAQFCHGMDRPHQWHARRHAHPEGAADLSRTVRSATGIDDQQSKWLERQPATGQVKSIVSGVPLAVISCRRPNPALAWGRPCENASVGNKARCILLLFPVYYTAGLSFGDR